MFLAQDTTRQMPFNYSYGNCALLHERRSQLKHGEPVDYVRKTRGGAVLPPPSFHVTAVSRWVSSLVVITLLLHNTSALLFHTDSVLDSL